MQVFPRTTIRTQPRRCAFTLIELLVVMSIVALLVALLLPALGKATSAGRRVRCLSNIKQMFAATAMYSTDNNGIMPEQNMSSEGTEGYTLFGLGYSHADYINNGSVAPATYRRFWGMGVIVAQGYASTAMVDRDPEASYDPTNITGNGNVFNEKNVALMTDVALQNAVNNGKSNPASQSGIYTDYIMPSGHFWLTGQTANPNQKLKIVRLGDKGRTIGGQSGFDAGAYTPSRCTVVIQCDSGGFDPVGAGPLTRPTYTDGCHFKEGLNTAYIDGHATWVPLPSNIKAVWRTATSGGRYYGNRDMRAQGGWPVAYASSLFQ